MRKHSISYHLYADDSQLYIHFNAKSEIETKNAISKMENCVSEISVWMKSNMLKLNEDKTEVILFQGNIPLPTEQIQIRIGDALLIPTLKVKNLGVIMDQHINMDQQVNNICKTCNFQMRNISRIRKYLTTPATKTIICANVLSRLDYANAMLCGASKNNIKKLQRTQNTAARIITKTQRKDHITPILRELHWLPISQQIQYKLMTTAYKATIGESPEYLSTIVQLHVPNRDLRSAREIILKTPAAKTVRYGYSQIPYQTAVTWNNLPNIIRSAPSTNIFKSKLKTYLFLQYYGNE